MEIRWKSAILAWNEDTVHSYYIALLRDGTFYYTNEENPKKQITTWRGLYHISTDTIYLHFQDKDQPPMRDYLIFATGGYLTQYFNNGKKMFLRKQQDRPIR